MTCLYLSDPKKNNEVKPSQVYKYLDYKAQSKDAKNVSRTMLRMQEGGELHSGSKFGTYKLPSTPTSKEEETPF